jgi:hypothetical protein
MPAFKLNVIKPSVNNMAARLFARAAGLDFAEHDVFGRTRSEEFLARNPAHLTPMIESNELRKGALWESSAIMQYLCNKHGLDQFYPKNPEQRATIDSAMFNLVGTLYPYVARATYPKLNFPQYAGKSVTAMATTQARKLPAKRRRRPSPSRWTSSINSTWAGTPSSVATSRRSPISGWHQRSSFSTSSTILSQLGSRITAPLWRRLSGMPMPTRQPMRAAISPMSGRRRAERPTTKPAATAIAGCLGA